MGTSVRDLRYLLETVLQCELVERSDHVKYIFKVNGRIVAETHYSRSWRGNKQIDDSILSKQAKEMRCSNRTWKLLLLGQVPKEVYFGELLQKGHITQEEYDMLCGRGNTSKKG